MGLITVALGRPLQVKIAEPLLWGLCFPALRSEAFFFSSSQDESHSFTHSSILGSYKMCSITDFTFSPRGLSVGLYRGQGNQALARKSRTLMSFV